MKASNIILGQLEKLELRQLWPKEDKYFTPWFAQVENIALLSSVIGIDLEVEGVEEQIGSYRADIVCKDTGSGTPVLIENQLESTDHSHLGQLITYAVGLDAVTIVWLSRKFSEPHKAAMKWLNEMTPETYRFFGLEIELWQIDDSAPALKLKVVAKPSGWTGRSRSIYDDALASQLQGEFHMSAGKRSQVGRLQKIDIDELWPKKDRGFRLFLAKNLQEVSGVLCIELQLVDAKALVDSSTDILAHKIPNDKFREDRDDEYVIIDTEYGNADHDYSRKLLSYAKEFDAYAVVWISENLRDEHKEALDRLNRCNDINTEFYGVEVEAMRINDSPPALRFEVSVAPDGWHTKDKPNNAREQSMNAEFIERLSVKLKERSLPERLGSRNYRSPYRIIEYPIPKVRYAMIWHRGEPGFEVVIAGVSLDWNSRIFQSLDHERAEIESELDIMENEYIFWQPPGSPNRDHSTDSGQPVNEGKVIVYRKGNVHKNKESWNEIQDWMISGLRKNDSMR